MADQITNYQCPTCTGPLHFDGASGKLVCEYCGSSFTTEEIEELYSKKDAEAEAEFNQKEEERAEAAAKAGQGDGAEGGNGENPWDDSGIGSEWGSDAAGMKSYSCPSCGAELICDETTAATSCPYCGNPTIIPGQFSGSLKPDYIIPFKLDKNAAITALKNHYKGKILLPGVFSKQNHIEEIKGIYVPFWLYDGVVEGSATFAATKVRVHRVRDEEITETDHYQIFREGSLAFSKVPADAASRMPDEHMDAIEPFNYQEIKPFSAAYLPGYLAEKYDVTAKDNIPRIEKRVTQTAIDQLRDTVTGYSTCTMTSNNFTVKRGKVSYAMLPVWMLYTKWQGKDYLFAMNGQTGKIVGNLPASKGKAVAIFAGVTAVVTLLLSFIL